MAVDSLRNVFSASSTAPFCSQVLVPYLVCIAISLWVLTLVTRKQMFIRERTDLSGTTLYTSGYASSAP